MILCTGVVLMSYNIFPDCKATLQRLAFVQYGFDRKEHTIDIKPHGNSKKQLSFKRTKPSTLQLAVKEN